MKRDDISMQIRGFLQWCTDLYGNAWYVENPDTRSKTPETPAGAGDNPGAKNAPVPHKRTSAKSKGKV